jgi:hypothetical protein
MSQTFARGGATGATVYTGTWDRGYIYPFADGTVTGVTTGGDTITAMPVLKGVVPEIEFGSISAAPALSLVIY